MCVIAIKPEFVSLSDADVSDMFTRNSDGLGVMWMQKGRVQTIKTLPRTPEEAIAALKRVPHEAEAVIHFRMATHGSVSLKNTHPFEVVPGLFVCHNGVLDTHDLGLKCGTGTDTEAYIKQYLKPILAHAKDPYVMAHSAEFRSLVGEHIGGNKFVFLDKTGKVSVVNRHMGSTIKRGDHSLWVSNTHWQSWAAQSPKKLAPHWSTHKDWMWEADEGDIKPLAPRETADEDREFIAFLTDAETLFIEQGEDLWAFLDAEDLADFFYDETTDDEDPDRMLRYLESRAITPYCFSEIVRGVLTIDAPLAA